MRHLVISVGLLLLRDTSLNRHEKWQVAYFQCSFLLLFLFGRIYLCDGVAFTFSELWFVSRTLSVSEDVASGLSTGFELQCYIFKTKMTHSFSEQTERSRTSS